jgi:hypothetical protein
MTAKEAQAQHAINKVFPVHRDRRRGLPIGKRSRPTREGRSP